MKILTIISILLLLGMVQAQRGGRSRSRRSSFRSSGSSNYDPNRPWTTTDYCVIGGIAATAVGAIALSLFFFSKQEQERKQNLQALMKNYEERALSNTCTMDPSKQQEAIDWFMKMNWTLQFSLINGSSPPKLMQFKVTDLKKKTDFLFQIEVRGSDSIGSSTLTGFLSLQKENIGIFLQKSYHNIKKARQTGGFNILIYEGEQQGQQLIGQWFYNNYQGSPRYSGKWRMFHD